MAVTGIPARQQVAHGQLQETLPTSLRAAMTALVLRTVRVACRMTGNGSPRGSSMFAKLATSCAILFALISPAMAQAAKPPADPAGGAGKKDAQPDLFALVQFHTTLEEGPMAGNGADRLELLKKSEIEPRRKYIEESFKKRLQTWEDEKKVAQAAHQKFTKAEPKMTVLKVINDTFKTEAEAKAFLDKEQKKTGHPATPPPGNEKPK
jgi:hypothetical protein